MVNIIDKVTERFNSFIKVSGECEVWQGYKDKDGYGTFYFHKKNRRAHRVAYYLKFGDIADGMVVDHLCGNRSCVNVSHLRLVSVRDNSLDNSRSVAAINAKKTHCKFGHAFDKTYGGQRYCSVCQREKAKRLRAAWKDSAKLVKC